MLRDLGVFISHKSLIRGTSFLLIVVHQTTKKTPFFLLTKNTIADSGEANALYELSCSGCGHSYAGKFERSSETRLSEHDNIHSYKSSAITQHLLKCPHVLYLANLNAIPDLDSSGEFFDKMHCPTSLAHSNSKIYSLVNITVLISCSYRRHYS